MQNGKKLIPPSGKKTNSCGEEKNITYRHLFFKELTGFYRTTKSWHEEIFAYFDEDCPTQTPPLREPTVLSRG